MRNRFHIHFRESDKQELLWALKEARQSINKAGHLTLFDDKILHAKLHELNVSIINIGEHLTQRKDYFLTPLHKG